MSDVDRTLVMCSGGLDSTAALIRAVRQRGAKAVAAIGFRYGQPAADAELQASQGAAEQLGVEWESAQISDALRGGIIQRVLPSGSDANGVNNANVPARNHIFLAVAAGRAGYYWPGQSVALVIGAHADDVATFPDCRPEFLVPAMQAGRAALAGVVGDFRIEAPWTMSSKADIVRTFADDAEALDLLRRSVSCYRGIRCGICGACVQRARAFAEAGVEDGDSMPLPMFGGDPHRERR